MIDTKVSLALSPKFEKAQGQLRLGNCREASRLYWEAATSTIEHAASRIGFQLSGRRLYSDVCDLLEPWYPHERTFGIYCSVLLLRTNALEDYGLEEAWIGELVDDVHELFNMLEFAVSQHGD